MVAMSGGILSVLPFLAAALLLVAAWRDLATRLIPDTVCILLAVAGLLARASEGLTEAAISLGLALGLFVLLLPIAVRGALGGGDVKLAAAVMVGLPPLAAWDFIFATAMLGGALGLAYIAGPRFAPAVHVAPTGATLMRRVLQVEIWRLRRRGPLPYAVAIAAGGIFVLMQPTGG